MESNADFDARQDVCRTPLDPSMRLPTWPDQHWVHINQGRLQVPEFTENIVTWYFARRTMSDGLPVGDMSSLDKSLAMFEKEYVSNMEVCCPPPQGKQIKPTGPESHHALQYFRACVHPEKKDGRYAVQLAVRVVNRKIEEIAWAKCGCPARRGPLAHVNTSAHFLQACQVLYPGLYI